MDALATLTNPEITDLEVWLWICKEKDVELELRNLIRLLYGATYALYYVDYIPASFEFIGDLSERSSCAKETVQLLFLVKNGAKIKTRKISKRFEVLNSLRIKLPKLYNEVGYKFYNTKF